MRILVDLVHPADVNFYKNAIAELRKDHEVFITAMDRGKLKEIARAELGSVTVVGRHSGGGFLKKILPNIRRVRALRRFISKNRIDVVTSFSYYPAAAAWGLRQRSVVFHDDAEYWLQFLLCRLFADRLVIPDFISARGKNIRKYHSYKEWAYLKGFKPSKNRRGRYVFIRDADTVSLNYKGEQVDLRKIVAPLKDRGLKCVALVEGKKNYPCEMLEEPVEDILSIIYNAEALYSTGDTMPREAALLGVPAYYAGDRDMAVNRELMGKNLIKPVKGQLLKSLDTIDKKKQKQLLKGYTATLEDTTRVILGEIRG